MANRELLEKAAKAAGIEVHRGNGWQSEMLFVQVPRPDGLVTGREWNLLTDDGDALRLAVKLDLMVMIGAARDCSGNLSLDTNDDDFAATRRAIVLAAAALGEQA